VLTHEAPQGARCAVELGELRVAHRVQPLREGASIAAAELLQRGGAVRSQRDQRDAAIGRVTAAGHESLLLQTFDERGGRRLRESLELGDLGDPALALAERAQDAALYRLPM
jgi:hypothetical protein